jgi:hypothetical protein
MKITEIISEAPSRDQAKAAEQQRAQLEFNQLKKFSPAFANEFMSQFRLIGGYSVDAAYQKAADEAAKKGIIAGPGAQAIKNANTKDKARAVRQFVSAIPEPSKGSSFKPEQPNEPEKLGRGKYKYYRSGELRGGDKDDTGIFDPDYSNKGANVKGMSARDRFKKAFGIGTDEPVGKNPVADFKRGAKYFGKFSDLDPIDAKPRYKFAASKKNPGKKL